MSAAAEHITLTDDQCHRVAQLLSLVVVRPTAGEEADRG